jgi:hypothetical protein
VREKMGPYKKNIRKKEPENPHEPKFEFADLKRILDVKREAVREWTNLGYVTPVVKAQGHGSRNSYSKANLIEIKLFRFLVDGGIVRREAANRVQAFSAMFREWPWFLGEKPHTLRFTLYRDAHVRADLFLKKDPNLNGNPIDDNVDIDRVELVPIGRLIREVERKIRK